MDPEVQRILVIAIAVVLVGIVALVLGRRLKLTRGDTVVETDRGRPTMSISATRGGSIEDAKQAAEGEATADMSMNARGGTIRRIDQRTGKASESSQ